MHSPYSRQNVRKGIFHYLLGRGMSGVAGFASVLLLVRAMDVDSYAGYTALSGLVMMIAMFSGLGLDRAVARYVPEGRENHSAKQLANFIWIIGLIRLSSAAILSGLLWLCWSQVVRLFSNSVQSPDFYWSLVVFLPTITLFEHFSSVFQALVLQKKLTAILIFQWTGRLGIIIFLWNKNTIITLGQALWIMTIPELVCVLALIIYINGYLKKLQRQSNTTEPWPIWQKVFEMALHNYGYNILAMTPQGYFMRILAASILPSTFVAAYGFFMSVIERIRQYLPAQLLFNLLEPLLIARFLKEKSFRSLNNQIEIIFMVNLLFLILGITLYAILGERIVDLFVKNEYKNYAWIFLVLLIQAISGTHAILCQLIFNAIDKSNKLFISSCIALLLMILYVVSILKINAELLVYAPLIYSIANNLLMFFILNILSFNYKIHVRGLVRAFLNGLLVYCLFEYYGLMNISISIILIIGTALFIFLVLLLPPFSKRQLRELRSMLFSKQ